MEYRVTCGCGRAVPVAAGAAGSRVACPCGRTVDVPSLRELRRSAGEADAVNPVLVIERLLAAGELLPGRGCTRCGRDDAAAVHVTATCERSWTKNRDGPWWFRPALPWFARLFVREGEDPVPGQRFGRDVSLRLPLRLCPPCRAEARGRADLCDALRQVPVYAALLDRYPDAVLTIEVSD